jgi:hypothetical protein
VFTVIVRVLLTLAFASSDPVGYFFAGFFSAHGYYRFAGVA